MSSSAPTRPPLDFIRRLPPADKQAVFLALLREAVEIHGDSDLMPILDEHGQFFGCYVSPKASSHQFQTLAATLTPQERERTEQALANLDRTFEITALFKELQQEDARSG